MTAYLHALHKRLEQRCFPVDDGLAVRVREAFDRVQHLHMTLHYLECDASTRR